MKHLRILICLAAMSSCVAPDLSSPSGQDSSTAALDTAGTVANVGATALTGNPAIGAAAGVLVTGLGAWFISKRKKPAQPVA